ncbi:MAG: hypothetical protein WDN02_10945 [Methylovirgula sp.]|uniref:hypothetical protein n=1 Tax=Methylovirgula sp. TaxID=1978224 RepID=UPI003075EF94
MRLNFNAIWVDDQLDRVRAQAHPISEHMERQGFEFNPTYCESIDDVRVRIAESVFNDEIDLVLVDWDLGNDVWGQNVIDEIRAKIPYKDVIFYSAHTSPDDLRGLAAAAHIDGIFYTTRGELVDEIINVFDSLVQKVLDLDHTRGIVMGATSDIDHMIGECLRLAHGRLDLDGKKELVKTGIKFIDDRLKDFTKRVEKLRNTTELDELLEAHVIFSAHDRLHMLSRILKLDTFSEHASARASVTTYMQEVVPDRNLLGHEVAEPGEGPKKVLNAKGEAIGVDEARELRRTILALRSDFRALFAALGGGD